MLEVQGMVFTMAQTCSLTLLPMKDGHAGQSIRDKGPAGVSTWAFQVSVWFCPTSDSQITQSKKNWSWFSPESALSPSAVPASTVCPEKLTLLGNWVFPHLYHLRPLLIEFSCHILSFPTLVLHHETQYFAPSPDLLSKQ